MRSGNNTRLAVSITVFIVLITLILDRLVPQGMFLDGITYASISRNLAIGKGSFWAPIFRSDVFFAEHPPLLFGLEAIFFKILGDHYLTEKVYCFVIWLLSIVLIRVLWRKNIDDKFSFTLPVLLWALVPTALWAYTNNILDTTMALFDMAAIIAIYNALQQKNVKKYLLLVIGSFFVSAALLTKGPVGAFPIGVPVAYWLAYETKSLKAFIRSISYTILVLLFVVATFAIIYQFPEAKLGLTRYLNEQLLSAMQGRREITGGSLGRLQVLADLFMLLLIPIAVGVILYILKKALKLQANTNNKYKKHILFFLLVGLGGSLPILISVKQRAFYLLPALPYYVLAISLLIYPWFYQLTERLSISDKGIKRYKILATVIAVGLTAYIVSKVNQIGRDKEMITEIRVMSDYLPKDKLVGICNEIESDYSFLSYIQRYNRVNVSGKFWGAPYVIVDSYSCGEGFVDNINKLGYSYVETGLSRYKLYKINYPLQIDFIQLNPVFRKADK